jgi:hypothetical protein
MTLINVSDAETHADWNTFIRLLEANEFTWEYIKTVTKSTVKDIGYDLTVPGPETFMNIDGVILSNTMNFHVPVSDKAVKQSIDRMLPSKNLVSLTDLRSPRHTPSMEMSFGLYQLTKPPSKKPVKTFATQKDAKAAYARGEIGATDPVNILEMK